jgi:hypothetical protein
MSRRDKLLDKMRNSPTNIRFSDVERLCAMKDLSCLINAVVIAPTIGQMDGS